MKIFYVDLGIFRFILSFKKISIDIQDAKWQRMLLAKPPYFKTSKSISYAQKVKYNS